LEAEGKPKVAIVVGSGTDTELSERAAKILEELEIPYEVKVLSAHRQPSELEAYIKACQAEVFIAIAGLSAHLPGFIASRTLKPVIGVPRDVKLGGLDALLSIVQMPRGVPVATVGIDNAENAAWLAARILALKDSQIALKLAEKRTRSL
jgi:5-(carboxyamino)imidazole ribonucleotide mutase